VADTEDRLVTTITESSVLGVTSRSAEELSERAEGVLSDSLEGMSWVMTMLVGLVALNAEIEVIAVNACYELVLGVFSDTGVASANWLVLLFLIVVFLNCRLFDRLGEGTRYLWLD
jgi:hypothetical protein